MLARVCLDIAQAVLLGSLPWGYLLYRMRTGQDIRTRGSGNIGATNVLRTAGGGLGLATLLLDAAKGFCAILLADYLSYQSVNEPYIFMKTGSNLPAYHNSLIALALVLVVVAHMYTPWLRFRGGRGVATALGAFLALAPWAAGLAVAAFAIVAVTTRYVSLSSIVAAVVVPLLMLAHYRSAFPPVIYAASILVCALVIWRHRDNIARLRAGNENRLFASSAAPARRRV